MLTELGELGGTCLERVNAAFESIQNLALLLGPPLAGLLIAWQGATTALWVDAGTFVFSAVVVGTLVPVFTLTSEAASDIETQERPSYRTQLTEGLRFLKADSLLRDMAIVVGIFNGLGAPAFAVALPVFAKQQYGNATVLGLMASGFAVGALVGVAAYGAIGHRLSRRMIWYLGYLAMPIAYWSLAAHPSLPILLAVLAIMGLFTSPLNPMMTTIRHERIPPRMRGRVFATYSAITQIVSPLGIVLGGFAIASFGLHPTVLALAIIVQVGSFGVLLVPSLRRMDAKA